MESSSTPRYLKEGTVPGSAHTVPTAAAAAAKHSSGGSMRREDRRQHGASQHVCI